MIDKSHLRTTMLALTGAELTQAHKTYERFLASARLDRSEPIENDEQAQAKIAALQALDLGPKDEVAPGAAVRIGDRYLVIGVSTAEFSCQGKQFVGISQAAPIYAALEGKRAGETCEFRGRKLQFHEVI